MNAFPVVHGSRKLGASCLLRAFVAMLAVAILVASHSARAESVPSLVVGSKSVRIPKDLVPWVPWVTDSVTDGLCPKLGEQALCVWPATLSFDVGTKGAEFSFDVYVDFESWVSLPGSERNWPEAVRVDGQSAVVLSKAGAPAMKLPRGAHRITGKFVWETAPETLMVPVNVGLVRLHVQGQAIDYPRREESGALWLQAGTAAEQDATDRVDIEVNRRIDDAVPLRVETQLLLRVSGKSRELRLTGLTLADSRPLELKSLIPARIEPSGELVLQVHAGEHRMTLTSLFPVPPARLAYPKHVAPWPEHETWVFVSDNALRQVDLSGASSIDSAQTALPEAWKSYPAFLISSEQALEFETKRRGEPLPPPDHIALERQLWLDFDGRGFTVKDHVTGTLSQSHRLDLVGYALGHASIGEKDLLVTRGLGGEYGVELRQPNVNLNAEWRYEGKLDDIPAIGWKTDVSSLSTTLNLPPGWDVVHVTGVDSTSDTWWTRWSLWGFFYVLLVAIAVFRLLDYRYGILALVTLVLIYGRQDAPMAYWTALVVLFALLRFVPAGLFRQGLRLVWLGTLLLFASCVVEYSVGEVRGSFFPTTHPPVGVDASYEAMNVSEKMANLGATEGAVERPEPVPVPPSIEPMQATGAGNNEVRDAKVSVAQQAVEDVSQSPAAGARLGRRLSQGKSGSFGIVSSVEQAPMVDPDAVVQTGPGLPNWRWRSIPMHWSGPVQKEQRIHAYLLSPAWTKCLAVLRVLGVLFLGLSLVRKTAFGKAPPTRSRRIQAAVAVTAIAFGLAVFARPASAEAQPSEALLSELKARLTNAPDCETCLEVESLELRVRNQTLETLATVHAGSVASYRVPGPVRSWVPGTVLVDGRASTAMVLGTDGFLYVRLEPGTHRVKTSGPVSGDEWVITPGNSSHRVQVTSEGYTVDGLRDGRVEGSLHFTATEKPKEKLVDANGKSSSNERHFPPWLEITRTVDLGVTWTITTEVVRKSPSVEPVSVRYELLPGEEITEKGAIVEQRQLVVALGRDDERISYRSVLKPTESIEFAAATERPWSEAWRVRCSALWHCAFDGVAPVSQTDESGYAPQFRPWPGEKLKVTLNKPVAAAGASRTIERAYATFTPGQRLLRGELELVIKVSKTGPLSVRLEPGVTVQKLAINGRDEPIRSNGSVVELSLQPGRQVVRLEWHESKPIRFWFPAPRVVLDGQAVNAKVSVRLPSERWLLFTWGPNWGPKVLLWSYVLMLVGAAWILVRIPKNPLKVRQWALLGLGLTQVPVAVALVVASWFFLMAYRGIYSIPTRWVKKLIQVGLCCYTIGFLGCLCGAVYYGLVSNPDMLVAGASSTDVLELSWYEDRIGGVFATPLVISLPVVAFRLLNLVWALWLASSLVRWLGWGWKQYAQGGLWTLVLEKKPDLNETVANAEKGSSEGSP